MSSAQSRGMPVLNWLSLFREDPDRQGLVIFFTGLSGSGKSTLARALYDRILEDGARDLYLLALALGGASSLPVGFLAGVSALALAIGFWAVGDVYYTAVVAGSESEVRPSISSTGGPISSRGGRRKRSTSASSSKAKTSGPKVVAMLFSSGDRPGRRRSSGGAGERGWCWPPGSGTVR